MADKKPIVFDTTDNVYAQLLIDGSGTPDTLLTKDIQLDSGQLRLNKSHREAIQFSRLYGQGPTTQGISWGQIRPDGSFERQWELMKVNSYDFVINQTGHQITGLGTEGTAADTNEAFRIKYNNNLATFGGDIKIKGDRITVHSSGNTYDHKLEFTTPTDHRTITFQDGSGTVAFLSDAPATNLSYTASTRLLESSTGTDVTLPEVVAGGNSGLITGADKTKIDGIEAGATGDQTAAEIRTLVDAASDSNVFTDADHSKLDGIEAGATGDQTAAEIRTLVDAASDSNVFTDADHSKLDGIESGATADQTAAEIRTLVDSATDSNVFTDADHTKLDGIAAGAEVNVATDLSYTASTRLLASSTGSDVTLPEVVASGNSGLITGADKGKLDGIEAGATADQTAAEIRTLVDAASDSNVFTDADHTKLDGIAAGAEVNVATNLSYTSSSRELASSTGTNVTLPEVSAGGDSGLMTGADKTKLDGLQAGQGSTNLTYTASTRVIASSSGTDATLPNVSAGGDSGLMTGADKTKLDGIEVGATADQTASEILELIKTVDGAGSGLNADMLDGVNAPFLRNADNINDGVIGDAYLPDSISPITLVTTKEIRTSTGNEIVLNAGESAGKFASQDAEKIYLNAEGGIRISTPTVNNYGTNYGETYTEVTGKGIYFRYYDPLSTTLTRMGEITSQDLNWLRINQDTDKNIYTPRYIRADAGFFVDGTTKGINGSGNFVGGTIAGASDYGTLLRSNANDTCSGEITFTSGIKVSGGFSGDTQASELVIEGDSPTITFSDTGSGQDDFYIHVASNNFYVLRDTGGGAGAWDVPHPLQIESDTNDVYMFGRRIIDNGNFSVNGNATFSTTTDQKIILQGSNQPYIRWRKGTTDKAYIQYRGNKSYSDLFFKNQQNGVFTMESGGEMTCVLALVRADNSVGSGNDTSQLVFGHTDGSNDWPDGQTATLMPCRIVAEASETQGTGDDGHRLRFYTKDTNRNRTETSQESFRAEQNQRVYFYNGHENSSDARIKDNVAVLENCLDKVLQLRGVEYDRIDLSSPQHDYGLIAQEVEQIFPVLVGESNQVDRQDGITDLKTLNYEGLIPVLIEAVKEQNAIIQSLQSRIEVLESSSAPPQ